MNKRLVTVTVDGPLNRLTLRTVNLITVQNGSGGVIAQPWYHGE